MGHDFNRDSSRIWFRGGSQKLYSSSVSPSQVRLTLGEASSWYGVRAALGEGNEGERLTFGVRKQDVKSVLEGEEEAETPDVQIAHRHSGNCADLVEADEQRTRLTQLPPLRPVCQRCADQLCRGARMPRVREWDGETLRAGLKTARVKRRS